MHRTVRALLALVLSFAACPALAQSPGFETPLRVDTTRSTVPFTEIRAGGPPPQGIPALGFEAGGHGVVGDTPAPSFVTPREAARWLADGEPVVLLKIEGDVRLYPMQILTWHEIVNDRVAGVPVAVTFCPLCNTAYVFDRRVPLPREVSERLPQKASDAVIATTGAWADHWRLKTGRDTAPDSALLVHFGTSGMLYNSNLLMFDSVTHTLWAQAVGKGVVGTLTGANLVVWPAQVVSFSRARTSYPDALVLERPSGYQRPYGENPYPGLDTRDEAPWMYGGEADERLPAMERVVAVPHPDDPVAIPWSVLRDAGVVEFVQNERPLIAFWAAGTVSALDAAQIADSRDVGAAGVFLRRLNGRTLNFHVSEQGILDVQSGSRWDLLGHAVAGPLRGEKLTPVVHDNTFWFAWGAFSPDTRIVRP